VTNLGEFALSHFWRRIPREIRDNFKTLRWDGDFKDGGVRWGRIAVTWRDNQHSPALWD
jgi:hypothetical protein